MGLLYGENCVILASTVFDWSTRVTDRRTDGIAMAYTRYSYAVARKKKRAVLTTLIASKFFDIWVENGITLYAPPVGPGTVRQTDRQAGRQIHDDGWYHTSRVSHSKNRPRDRECANLGPKKSVPMVWSHMACFKLLYLVPITIINGLNKLQMPKDMSTSHQNWTGHCAHSSSDEMIDVNAA